MEILLLDQRRGHAFCPPAELLDQIPALYSTENVATDDKTVWLHFFVGSADWWIVELDQSNAVAFGYANLGDPANAEWGYIPLDELALVHIRGDGPRQMRDGTVVLSADIVVERDLHWTPRPWRNVRGS